jgi:hypothetical protein
MSEPEPPRRELPRAKARLPFEEKPFARPLQRGAVLIYGVLTAGLVGLALYMWLVAGHPLVSPYVAGPGIGAIWFGLRVFMMLGSRN